ncbi:MAG: hypothetical protein ACR2PL_02080, partial [Dehalococcoidia bacterium]
EEIVLLRSRLHAVMDAWIKEGASAEDADGNPGAMLDEKRERLILQNVSAITRAVQAQARLTAAAGDDVGDRMAATMDELDFFRKETG